MIAAPGCSRAARRIAWRAAASASAVSVQVATTTHEAGSPGRAIASRPSTAAATASRSARETRHPSDTSAIDRPSEDPAATDHLVADAEHGGLPGRDPAHRRRERDLRAAARRAHRPGLPLVAVAHLHARRDRPAGRGARGPTHVLHAETVARRVVGGADHDASGTRLDPDDVARRRAGPAEAPALTDREPVDAGVTPEHLAVGRDDLAAQDPPRRAERHVVARVALRHEADLLRLRLVGVREAGARR